MFLLYFLVKTKKQKKFTGQQYFAIKEVKEEPAQSDVACPTKVGDYS
jgi:hypothetical protein